MGFGVASSFMVIMKKATMECVEGLHVATYFHFSWVNVWHEISGFHTSVCLVSKQLLVFWIGGADWTLTGSGKWVTALVVFHLVWPLFNLKLFSWSWSFKPISQVLITGAFAFGVSWPFFWKNPVRVFCSSIHRSVDIFKLCSDVSSFVLRAEVLCQLEDSCIFPPGLRLADWV
jgi:hypothetical protein